MIARTILRVAARAAEVGELEEWESEDSRERCVPVVGGEEVVRELSEQERRGVSGAVHVFSRDTAVPEEVKEEHLAESRIGPFTGSMHISKPL